MNRFQSLAFSATLLFPLSAFCQDAPKEGDFPPPPPEASAPEDGDNFRPAPPREGDSPAPSPEASAPENGDNFRPAPPREGDFPAPSPEASAPENGDNFRPAPPREGDFPPRKGRPERNSVLKFENFDSNNDGVIDKEEFKKIQTIFRRPPQAPRYPKEGVRPPKGDRPRYDARPEGDRPRDGHRKPNVQKNNPPKNLFRFDKNEDGVISADEMPKDNKNLQQLFNRLDKNKDGKLDKTELKGPRGPKDRPGDRPESAPQE